MITLKTDPDYLHRVAADHRTDGRGQTATDIDSAAHDIKNLRDYAEQAERTVNQLSAEINSIRTQRDEAAAALLAIFRPELERMIEKALDESRELERIIEEAVEECRLVDNLRERIERLEDNEQNADDAMRDTVRDMIRDGDIIVSIDHA